MKRLVLLLIFILSLGVLVNAQDSMSMPSYDELNEGWNTLVPGGETLCSIGSPYEFHVYPNENSDKLMVYFNGGGACWFGQACDINVEPNIHTPAVEFGGNNPEFAASGIFDLTNPENPARDYNIVFLPYCTGDVFIGAGDRTYQFTDENGLTREVVTHHRGYTNTTAVLDWVYQNFETPSQVVVAGSSAGAIGSSFYTGLVAEHYPNTPIIHLGDGAGGYRSELLFQPITAWNTVAILPGWDEYLGESNNTLTFEDFYIAVANRFPNVTVAQYNTAHDEVQNAFLQILGENPAYYTLPQNILRSHADIEDAVETFHTYMAGGSVHTILRSPLVYEYEVEGVPFVDWLTALLNGEEVDDISCVDDEFGCLVAPGEVPILPEMTPTPTSAAPTQTPVVTDEPEITPEVTPEITPEITEEPETTPEVTVEPTEDPETTPEVTVEPTEDPVIIPPEETEEASPEPEVTEEAGV